MTGSPASLNKRLLFVADFLVDCGSAVSVLPPTPEEKRSPSPTEHNLSAANGQSLRTFGRRSAHFIFLGRPCSHDMIVADVVHPILGMDFLQDGDGKRCIIDPYRRCLTDRYTMEEFPIDTKTSSVFSLIPATSRPQPALCYSEELKHTAAGEDFEFLWAEFPEVTEPSLSKLVTMTTPLHIVTDGSPVYTPCRKLHGEKKTQVEEQLRQWERQEIIQRCESNWASPIHAVKKSDGSWRVCGDFRRLNAMTKLDRYPLPALSTFNERLAGCTVFSKVDLKQAFQQVCVDESSQEKTAIITTLGLFKFLRMPYGLKNAAQCFQRNVHQLLSDLPFAHFVYMDDLIVGSSNREEHVRDLRRLFQRLKETGLLLNRDKCQLGRASLTFLGHVVDSQGIAIPPERVEAIRRFPVPTTPKELERFLGICAFFHRFVPHASGKMASLSRLKSVNRQKDFEEAWLPEHDHAFADVKAAIATATLLVHPLLDAPTEIWCDASNIAVGAVLVQLQRGMWKPLSFWSRQLNKAQRNYSATDRELLAVSYSVDKFRSYLEGQPIIVRTDHKPLVGSVTKKADTALPIPRRHLLKIAQFVEQLHYLKGERNGVADALSRVLLQSKVATAMNAIGIWSSQQDDLCHADTLPTEGSRHAIQEDVLVDQMFVQRLKHQRDMHRKQLRAPVFVPATPSLNVANTSLADCVTTPASSEVSTSSLPSTRHEFSDADNRTASVQACCAIFTPRPAQLVALPSPSDIRSVQERDQPLQNWIAHHRSSASRFRPALVECEDGTSVWADISATPARILVPTTLQRIVFDNLHRLAHPGLKAGLILIKRSYWWQGISRDVAKWTKSCESCQKAKIHVHTKMPLERLPAPTKRFSHIHIDIVGPLNPACEGKNTLLTIIDRWTGWPEAYPMTMHGEAANAKACATVLVREWLSRWGVPDVITSDRGSQFVSDLWLEVCSLMGIARDPTTSYHPQHNGKIERMHRCLKNSLRARLLGRTNWLAELPWVMLGLRAAANLDTGVSPSILVTGQQPALPGQLVVQRASIDDTSSFGKELSSAMAAQTFNENPWHGKQRGRSHVPHDLWTATRVLVRADKVQPSLVPKYTGPFRVLRRWGKCFRLQMENREDTVSVDRLRPFYEDETDRREPTTDVVGTANGDRNEDRVEDLVVRRSNRTVRPPIRFRDIA